MGGGGDGGNPLKDILSGTVAGFAQVAVGENPRVCHMFGMHMYVLFPDLSPPQKVHLLRRALGVTTTQRDRVRVGRSLCET